MKLSILLTLALVGCGTDSKDTPVTATTETTAPVTTTEGTNTETATDYFAIVQTAARALTKGQTMAAVDATALGKLSLSEDTTAGSKAYYKGLDRVTFWICPGTTTVQAYTIKSEAKVLLYTSCADMLGERAPELAIRDVLSEKLNAEQFAYYQSIRTTETDGLNGNPPKYYRLIVSRFTNGSQDYYYTFDICENGKVFYTYNGNSSPATTSRDTTICN